MEDHLPSKAFGLAAREIRKERKLSQEQAALNGKIDRAYYGHIERATKNATLPTIWKMATPSACRRQRCLRGPSRFWPRRTGRLVLVRLADLT
jgi:DNA-binding XRE family transcriptional regulator